MGEIVFLYIFFLFHPVVKIISQTFFGTKCRYICLIATFCIVYIDWKPLKIQIIWRIISCNPLWNVKVIAILLNLCQLIGKNFTKSMRPMGRELPGGPGEPSSPNSINIYWSEASWCIEYKCNVLRWKFGIHSFFQAILKCLPLTKIVKSQKYKK